VEQDLSTQRRAAYGGDASAEDHRALAAGARHAEGRPLGFANRAASEEETQPAQGAHRGGAEEAEVSHGDEPFGEHVEEPAADELPRLDRFALPLCIGTIFVPQQNAAAFIVGGEAALVEGGFGDVGCEIAHGAAAASSGSAIGHPFLVPNSGVDLPMQFGVTAKQTLGKQVADASGERQDVDEELFVGRMEQLTALEAQRDRRNEDVDVRMVEHSPGPGLQHCSKAAFATEVLGIAKEIPQRLRALGEQGVVEFARMP